MKQMLFNPEKASAVEIVKAGLQDPDISIQTKTRAIEQVAGMATHNGVTKEDLVNALRWIFEHYDFQP